jgi:hypothetical protein
MALLFEHYDLSFTIQEKGVHRVESYAIPCTTITILRWLTLPAQEKANTLLESTYRVTVALDPSLIPVRVI